MRNSRPIIRRVLESGSVRCIASGATGDRPWSGCPEFAADERRIGINTASATNLLDCGRKIADDKAGDQRRRQMAITSAHRAI